MAESRLCNRKVAGNKSMGIEGTRGTIIMNENKHT